MSLHPPKQISSIEGLGLNTTKTLEQISDSISIGTEVWNKLEEPWRQGRTVIAKQGYVWRTKWEAGKPYIITKFYDENNGLIAVYCDVSRPVQSVEGGYTFVDLYLDVWMLPGQPPILLDEDELDDAVKAGYITQDESINAGQVAKELMKNIKINQQFLDF